MYVCLSFKREIANSIKVSIAAYVGPLVESYQGTKQKQEFTILKQLKNWLMSVRNALVESEFLISRKNLLLFTLLRKITGLLNKS